MRGTLVLRRDRRRKLYVEYRNLTEYDRRFELEGVPFHYVLVRQELSGGVRLVEGRQGLLRLGAGPANLLLWLPDYGETSDLSGMGEYLEGELNLLRYVRLSGRWVRLHAYHDFGDPGRRRSWN